MREKIQSFRKRFLNVEDLSIRLMLFNIITIIGIVGGSATMIISAFIGVHIYQLLAIVFAEFILVISFYLANWYGKTQLASLLLTTILSLVVFPVVYFTGGGLNSGACFWFAIGMLFSFLLLDGKLLVLEVILQSSAVLFVYLYGYLNPETVTPLKSNEAVLVDVLQSLFIMAITFGIIFRMQHHVYRSAVNKIKLQNDELLASKAEADKANKAKSDFLSSISHEIRSPLNSIIGMNELILRDSVDENAINYATIAQSSSRTLLELIDDILDISKIEAGKIELVKNEYEILTLISDCYQMMEMQAETKDLKLEVQIENNLPSVLYGDCTRIRQILVNFLSNSIKYTDEGTVAFRIRGDRKELFVNLVFEIEDTGIGMKPESLEKLFDKFERFDNIKNKDVKGTGLGMSIAKQLSDMMNGTINVKSEYGVGTKLTFEVPQIIVSDSPVGKVNIVDYSDASDTVKDTKNLYIPNVQILVVDDMNVNIMIVENFLEPTGAKVDAAMSGKECIAKCKSKRYDLILMDQMMPEMDGSETLKQLQKIDDAYGYEIPVVMLTANALSGMKEKYLAEGFAEYITKPVVRATLIDTISRLLPDDKIMRYIPEQNKDSKIASSDISDLLTKLPELNLEEAMKYCAGSEDFLCELMRKYFLGDSIDKFVYYYDKKIWDKYQIEVHSMKSSCRTFGLSNLADKAKGLEQASKESDYEYINMHHNEVLNELLRIRDLMS